MPIVMLKRNWPGNFRRSVRTVSGELVRVIELEPGGTATVSTEDELRAVAQDIGAALVEVKFSEEAGKFVNLEKSEIAKAADELREFRELEASTAPEPVVENAPQTSALDVLAGEEPKPEPKPTKKK